MKHALLYITLAASLFLPALALAGVSEAGVSEDGAAEKPGAETSAGQSEGKEPDEQASNGPAATPPTPSPTPAPPVNDTPPAAAGTSDFFGEAHRQRMYESSRLKPSTAVLYNLAFPGLGNIYTEQYFIAGTAFTLMAFAAVFVGFGLNSSRADIIWLGAGTAAAAYAGSIATSLYGVSEYNRLLREGLKIAGPGSVPAGNPTFSITFRF